MANAKPATAATRILLLVTSADWGGVQGFLVRFAAYLKAQGVDVLLAAGGPGRIWEEARRSGIATHRLRHVVRDIDLLEDVRAVNEISALIDEWKPDAIHLNSSKMGVIGSLAAARSKTKPWTVYRIGGWAFLEHVPAWKRALYLEAERRTAKHKDVIVTVHPGDEKLAHEKGIEPRSAVVTIPNGLPEGFTGQLLPREVARQTLDLPKDVFVFGTVANAYPPKALPTYVRTLERTFDELSDAHAVIIGGGPGLADLRNIVATLEHRDRIHLAGERADAARLYRAFDAFVLPSEKEGMPWALLEAMAAGLPCIATDVGACRWMLIDNFAAQAEHEAAGIIVPARDEAALTQALIEMSRYPLLRRSVHDVDDPDAAMGYGRVASTVVKKYLTWDKCASRHHATLMGHAKQKNTR